MTSYKRWTLYVLKLKEDKYYVGITSQTPENRLNEHLRGRKSYWTEKYPPLKIIQTVNLGELDVEGAKLYENKVVRKYIREKGINNVRGGDITGKNNLVVRFGYIFDELTWEAVIVVTIQSVFMFILIVLYYLK